MAAVTPMRGGPIHWARNELAAQVLDNPAIEEAVYLDADVVPTLAATMALLEVDGDITCVPYPVRVRRATDLSGWACWASTPVRVRKSVGHRLVALSGAGCGLMRVRRHALERMVEAYVATGAPLVWSESLQRPRSMAGLFNYLDREVSPERGPECMWEDRSFCFRALDAGLRVEALCDLAVKHANGEETWDTGGKTFADTLGLPAT
jgi:hypothetical protein